MGGGGGRRTEEDGANVPVQVTLEEVHDHIYVVERRRRARWAHDVQHCDDVIVEVKVLEQLNFQEGPFGDRQDFKRLQQQHTGGGGSGRLAVSAPSHLRRSIPKLALEPHNPRQAQGAPAHRVNEQEDETLARCVHWGLRSVRQPTYFRRCP